MPESMVQNVVQRAGVISFGTLAEIDHFQHERCVDFKDAMTTFLSGQINFYQEVSSECKVSILFNVCSSVTVQNAIYTTI